MVGLRCASRRLSAPPGLNHLESTWGREKSHPKGSGDFFPVDFSKPDSGRCLLLGNCLGASR
eukprot:3266831-Pyramimonas_sp.AAC.1